jgi:hypothetical protein
VAKGQKERDFPVDSAANERNTPALSTSKDFPALPHHDVLHVCPNSGYPDRERGVSIRVRPISVDAGRPWMLA